ncbi:MAG: ketohexokinase [gamma proteobacterium symbiont of Bathyaustriella thionipta]|nr:ketohexokinase [gamma proteobacterium symbiont of Bathyaustriella thionipta]MCU7950362.1 ketohexokinase [gamma proteobacterium symbiont of Bathyaustriella thionipta]MCU7951864.1 ketohexokinase [gamma proteobacterium symbiont of Bathyaustriella thionipta]MCU7956114.1 ketohexokinase [gamma proteobacterium symbiont of Bathyaustriella thionipta]MCU7966473.1 ketohexokinase [gamma proteobacterium symbiont of Bathyaustriella thionipta]
MAKILCVGIATVDIVNEVASYPSEDDEIRILAQDKCRGGNAANTSVVLSQLGHQCYWAGTLVNEADCRVILDDFEHYQINYKYGQLLAQGKVPTSYIILNQATGSRTISHYRDLPEYHFNDFININLQQFEHIHFEGRNVEQTLKMMAHVKAQFPGIVISLELEKSRDNIESLIKYADIIIFSRHYAQTQGFNRADDFCQYMGKKYTHKIIFCAWGSLGAAAIFKQNYYWQDAYLVDAVDTLAAGDVFNAAIIDHQIKKKTIQKSLANACKLAAQQCAHKGIELV